ncbi:MAG: efflux RND transporter permease subunit, partial [Candidatus Zixiibacteriota bacterium]
TLTLVGIGVALGMLLDTSIVVLARRYRQKSHGMPTEDAVVTGTGEVLRAITAATLTTICVFLPFVYSGNFLIRTIGKHVGVSIIATLIVSLIVAFLLIPAFTYRAFGNKSAKTSKSFFNVVSQRNRLLQLYTLLLKSTLRFPARTVITGTVVFFLSVVICLALSVGVPEEVELNEFNFYAQLPSGSTLDAADVLVADMESRLDEIAEVGDRQANIYEDNAVFTFTLKDGYKNIAGRDIANIKDDVMEKVEGPFPRVEFSFEQPASNTRYRGGGGGGGSRGGEAGLMRMLGIGSQREKVVVRGQNFPLMRQVAEEVKVNLEELDYVDRAWINLSEGRPEIQLLFDRQALSHFGVTLADVMAEMSSFQEEYSSSVSYKDDNEEVDIVLHNSSLEDKTADDIRALEISPVQGGTVPLMQLADLIYSSGVFSINRVNQEKEIEVSYRFSDPVNNSKPLLESSRLEIEQLAASVEIPAGIAIEVVHDETDYSEFYFLIAAAFILIFMVLASAFESLATPIVMMVTIPLATIGAFWGLIATGQSVLNANVMIGFLILLGVVVNNGIILIDYSRTLQNRGYRLQRALLVAGQARVRPILITALTTIVAMFPLAMGKAEYVAQIGAPFAITVIGGLTAGTLFTLVFIPTVYSGMVGVLAWWSRLRLDIRLIQLALFAVGCWFIYYNIDSLTWKLASLCALTAVIPGTTYFTMTSLRRASAQIIPLGEPIRITVRNVVKVYGDYSRFIKEYSKGDRQSDRFEREGINRTSSVRRNLGWQIPIYIFSLYFVYSYLESDFWLFVLVHPIYIATVSLARRMLTPVQAGGEHLLPKRRIRKIVFKLLFWGLPLANLALFQTRWENPVLEAIIGAVWYVSLAIYSTSRKLYRENININRISGRFRRTRKLFYRFVKVIPVIGKKKQPFRALNQVSMEIGSGMFGLVGPNGAGKTTLMRIICGVLDQSRGSIWINGIDLNEKREELQGLIGYLPQEFGTYENMTAYQFLDQQAMLRGILDSHKRREAVERSIRSVHLEENRDVKIKSFSGGMKQRVGIAQTLLHLPRILVVDEPTAGLDPRERIRFRNLLSDLARDRVVIFSTHVIEDISSSCNRVAVLGDGVVKFLGTPQEMVDRTRGKVWQTHLSDEEFDSARSTLKIVHHMRDNGKIRVRVLASEQPVPDAIQVTPTLEDSYLWLIGKKQ